MAAFHPRDLLGTGIFAKFEGLFSGGGLSAESCVGLSIGSSSIKLVELKRSGKQWKLLHFGIVQLPEDAIVNREIVNHIAVVDNLKTLTNQLKLKTRNVCTAISGTSLIIKRMSLEIPNARETQDQVFWEAEQYIPFDVSEVVMDYHVISRTKEGSTDALLVAVKRSVLDSYVGCIADSGLKAKIVDVDFFALQNAYEANYPASAAEAVALVDIGASSTKISVVHAGVPVFTKDSSLGGKNLTADIQRHLGLSYADAETLKVAGPSQGMPAEISDLMHVMAENFGTEVKRALDFYNASSSGAPVTAILLCGGSAKIPDLPRIVEETTGIPAQILNPFNSISYDPGVFTAEYMAAIAPIAAIPVGLALRAGVR
jgi:type IV pilus assembly protein PilM